MEKAIIIIVENNEQKRRLMLFFSFVFVLTLLLLFASRRVNSYFTKKKKKKKDYFFFLHTENKILKNRMRVFFHRFSFDFLKISFALLTDSAFKIASMISSSSSFHACSFF